MKKGDRVTRRDKPTQTYKIQQIAEVIDFAGRPQSHAQIKDINTGKVTAVNVKNLSKSKRPRAKKEK